MLSVLTTARMSRTLTGAWIETESLSAWVAIFKGRTLTGAWIETISELEDDEPHLVAPSRVRGLKPCAAAEAKPCLFVAPSRVRGLKPQVDAGGNMTLASHPHGCVD